MGFLAGEAPYMKEGLEVHGTWQIQGSEENSACRLYSGIG